VKDLEVESIPGNSIRSLNHSNEVSDWGSHRGFKNSTLEASSLVTSMKLRLAVAEENRNETSIFLAFVARCRNYGTSFATIHPAASEMALKSSLLSLSKWKRLCIFSIPNMWHQNSAFMPPNFGAPRRQCNATSLRHMQKSSERFTASRNHPTSPDISRYSS
jgi:hypothetical protein